MTTRRAVILILLVLLGLFLWRASLLPESANHFKATYTGSVNLSGDQYKGSYRVEASSVASSFGESHLRASGSGHSEGYCAIYDGVGTIQGARGSLKIALSTPGRACAGKASLDSQDGGETLLKVSGNLDASDGTGVFSGLSGQLKFAGDYSTDSGHLSIIIEGDLQNR